MAKLLTTQALADRYGVGVNTILTWRRKGWISASRVPGQLGLFFNVENTDQALRSRGYVLDHIGMNATEPDGRARGTEASPVKR